jgi:hypothetical protein
MRLVTFAAVWLPERTPMIEIRLSRQEIVTIVMALEEFRETGDRDLAARVNEALRLAAGNEFLLVEPGWPSGEKPRMKRLTAEAESYLLERLESLLEGALESSTEARVEQALGLVREARHRAFGENPE